jgi:transcription antitermination factor NusG
MQSTDQHWFALYTKPRWEKKVHKLLGERGFESYCPLNKVRRKWSDRIKTVEEPLFKSYVFVRVTESLRPEVRFVDGVLNFVYWNSKPAIVRDEEIIEIKKFMSEYEEVQVGNIELKASDNVMLNAGVMMGATGSITRILGNNTIEVRIDSLGFVLTAKLDRKTVVKIS